MAGRKTRRNHALGKVEHEHYELRKVLDRLNSALEEGDLNILDVQAAMRDLLAEVRHHFEHEEEGGYFDEIAEHAPRLRDRIMALKQEHVQFLNCLNDLIELADQRDTSQSAWNRIKSRYQSFLRQLLAHEASENDLVQEAYGDDIGALD